MNAMVLLPCFFPYFRQRIPALLSFPTYPNCLHSYHDRQMLIPVILSHSESISYKIYLVFSYGYGNTIVFEFEIMLSLQMGILWVSEC